MLIVGFLSVVSAFAELHVLVQVEEPRRNGDGGTLIFGVHKVMPDNGSEVFTGLTLVATVAIEKVTDKGVELMFNMRNRFKVSNFREENGSFTADVTEDGSPILPEPMKLFCHWNYSEGFILPGRLEGLFIQVWRD